MIRRQQLAVRSPVSANMLAAGAAGALGLRRADGDLLARTLAGRLGASAVALTDSGTSALVLALRLLAGPGGTVALPGYGCIDLSAAAVFAGVRVVLYDLEPASLSPDLDSVRRVLQQGARTIVLVHLFGYPADAPAVVALAREHGASVIEDAAQAAGATLHGRPLGTFGTVAVLSFGRGKGTTGGGGGALVAANESQADGVLAMAARLRPGARGWKLLAATAAQWAFGRPALYAFPASIPSLRLGEMVYHPAHEPAAITPASCAALRVALQLDRRELAARRANAERLQRELSAVRTLTPVDAIAGAMPGYLRLPMLRSPSAGEVPTNLGIVRPYPSTLAEHAPLQPTLVDRVDVPGARVIRDRLVALPTHGLVGEMDIVALRRWGEMTARNVGGAPGVLSSDLGLA